MDRTVVTRSIDFGNPEVLGTLEGDLREFRRRMVPQPPSWVDEVGISAFAPEGYFSARGNHPAHGPAEKFLRPPFGMPGDLLSVREDYWSDLRDRNVIVYDATPEWGKDRRTGVLLRSTYMDEKPVPRDQARRQMLRKFWGWRGAQSMARDARRILLRVESTRAERAESFRGRRPGLWYWVVGITRLEPTPPTRKEQCTFCWNYAEEWVDPHWWNGRLCKACEPLAEAEARSLGRLV